MSKKRQTKNAAAQALAATVNQPQLGTTHKGAATYTNTGSRVYDFFSQAGAMRARPEEALNLFTHAIEEDAQLAIRALFYLRDIRGGQGEREIFRKCINWLASNYPNDAQKVVQHIPEFGRWKDVIELMNCNMQPVQAAVQGIIKNQWTTDVVSQKPSLLAKWMPSENASSKQTKYLAKRMHSLLNLKPQQYRQALTKMRAKLNIVETLMSAGKWNKIDYSKVHSRAGLIYKTAFHKHDGTRYTAHINNVIAGKTKINSSTLYPHELVARVNGPDSATIEALWKSLPNYVENDSNTLCVVDSSSSMGSFGYHVKSKPQNFSPFHVAVGIALYFAERTKGAFHNIVARFSTGADLVKVSGSLADRVRQASNGYVGSTNLEALFDEILKRASKTGFKPSDMIDNLVIISDMEFDEATAAGDQQSFMDSMKEKFRKKGFKLPRIVFWNVNAYGGNCPVTADSSGMFMLSGHSQSAFKYILENRNETAEDVMKNLLNGPRYSRIVI